MIANRVEDHRNSSRHTRALVVFAEYIVDVTALDVGNDPEEFIIHSSALARTRGRYLTWAGSQ